MIKPLVIAKSKNGTLGLVTGSTVHNYGTHTVTEWHGVVLEDHSFVLTDNRPHNPKSDKSIKDILPKKLSGIVDTVSKIISLEEKREELKEKEAEVILRKTLKKGEKWSSVEPEYVGEVTPEQILEIMTAQTVSKTA